VSVHGAAFAAVVSPARGGGIEELTHFASGVNLADVLTRRREAYHLAATEAHAATGSTPDGGMPSIHDIEKLVSLEALPPEDRAPRAIFLECLLYDPPDTTVPPGDGSAVRSWAGERFAVRVECRSRLVRVLLGAPGLDKRIEFDHDGAVTIEFAWSPEPAATWFITELSLSRSVTLETDAAGEWRHPIETIAKSERGLERTVQGEAVVLGWPVEAGRGRVRLAGGGHAGGD
jgi:hypothetical protein